MGEIRSKKCEGVGITWVRANHALMMPAKRLLLGSVSGAPMFELISQSRMITFGSGLVIFGAG